MIPNYKQEDEQQQIVEEAAKRKVKQTAFKKLGALGKKGGKLAAQVIVKSMIAVTKAIIGALASIGIPYALIIIGVLLLLFFVYLGTSILFSNDESYQMPEQQKQQLIGWMEEEIAMFHLDQSPLERLIGMIESDNKTLENWMEDNEITDEQLLRFVIELLADNTVDLNRPEQIPFRVPEQLIISALQIYDSTKHGKTQIEAAEIMADTLRPLFEYTTVQGYTKTTITTCIEGKCEIETETIPYTLNLLTRVDAWNQIVTGIITPIENSDEFTTQKTVHKETTNQIGEVEIKEVEQITTVQTFVKGYNYEQIIDEDYTYYDRVLSEAPFDYGQQDKFMVEAVYQATGGDIGYSEWLAGGAYVEFDGTIIPGSGIPTEFMQYYLEAEKIYKVNWYYIAALHYVETGFSTHPTMISSAGAEGHLQFMPCTWLGWSYSACKGSNGAPSIPDNIKYNPYWINYHGGYGQDANKNGISSPWEIEDAIYTAAYYLNKNGGSKNIENAVFQYNHADWYVDKVLTAAGQFRDQAVYSGSSSEVVQVGEKWIGNSKYVFGGGRNQNDILKGRFDCSSFVHWAFNQVGINLETLTATSTETLKNKGVAVSVSDMQPGDLVFFDTYKKDGHVGIYAGNGKFIGAQSSTGVAYADMSKGYWKSVFNGRVKRVIN